MRTCKRFAVVTMLLAVCAGTRRVRLLLWRNLKPLLVLQIEGRRARTALPRRFYTVTHLSME
jgi:hypothetical protein